MNNYNFVIHAWKRRAQNNIHSSMYLYIDIRVCMFLVVDIHFHIKINFYTNINMHIVNRYVHILSIYGYRHETVYICICIPGR